MAEHQQQWGSDRKVITPRGHTWDQLVHCQAASARETSRSWLCSQGCPSALLPASLCPCSSTLRLASFILLPKIPDPLQWASPLSLYRLVMLSSLSPLTLLHVSQFLFLATLVSVSRQPVRDCRRLHSPHGHRTFGLH